MRAVLTFDLPDPRQVSWPDYILAVAWAARNALDKWGPPQEYSLTVNNKKAAATLRIEKK